jgi:hypothetical protein
MSNAYDEIETALSNLQDGFYLADDDGHFGLCFDSIQVDFEEGILRFTCTDGTSVLDVGLSKLLTSEIDLIIRSEIMAFRSALLAHKDKVVQLHGLSFSEKIDSFRCSFDEDA